MRQWSNLAKVVYKRTYSRNRLELGERYDPVTSRKETWPETVDRVLAGNFRITAGRFPTQTLSGPEAQQRELEELRQVMLERMAGPAGRGYWFSGTEANTRIGGVALCNCWYLNASEWTSFVTAMDMLMLGGGVGLSVEHRFTSKLPRVRKDVTIVHRNTKDADFIVPDSREGWLELFRRVLEAYFVTGRGFSYSTVCVRAYGETINGFGGTASGPGPLVRFVENLGTILNARAGRAIRPVDAMDLICATGEMVVAGNVRRSAIIILGDAHDKEYLKAKRWDLGAVPTWRATANLSVVADDVDDLHPLFWKTYEAGEPFGIVNRKNIQQFGRMGELKPDTAEGVNPCAEATLEPFEPCNLQEIALANVPDPKEFARVARLMHRYGKRVTLEPFHIPEAQKAVTKNRRVGTGITGCLERPDLFNPEVLDHVYREVQQENEAYSQQLGIAPSIRTTVIKPSGTMSKLMDCRGEGVHPAYSRHMIQRVRFASNDPLIPLLKAAGHPMEPVVRFDGTLDPNTMVVDFYLEAPADCPVADEGFTTWRQLDTLLMAQRHWADQAVSVTVYYRREELPEIKVWLAQNLQYLKTISFLCHSDHGFKQAPKEAMTAEAYERLSSKIKPIEMDEIKGDDLDSQECAGGVCPIK